MRIDLHPEARAEIRSTVLWYEERRPGLGLEFLNVIDAIFQRIAESPKQFPRWPGTGGETRSIRRAIAERFPYCIAFENQKSCILVLAVAHEKRRPLYWFRRRY